MREPLYLPRKRLKRATNSEIRQLFEELFSISYPESMMIRCNILIALFYCTYLSVSDLSYYLGMPENSFASLNKQLKDMEQAGFVKQVPLKTKDGFSRKLFYLSESGFIRAASYIQVPFLFTYRKRGKIVTTMHDYSIGLNALQLILFGMPFQWAKEVSYSGKFQGMKQMGSLCVDAVCSFSDTRYRMFLEEDLGTESIGILIGKLEKYHNFDLLREADNEVLVYSFRQPYVTCDAPTVPAYSSKNIGRIIDFMEKGGYSLHQAVTVLKSDTYIEGKIGEKEELLSIFTSLKSILKLNDTKKDLTASQLKVYQMELETFKSDYRMRDYNQVQEQFTRSRYRSMAGILAKHYRNNPVTVTGVLSDLMKGFSIYCCSTTLLMNEIPYYFYPLSGMEYTLSYALSRIFPGIDASTYRPLIKQRLEYNTGAQRLLHLKNAFMFSKGTVCVEYIGRDLGALIRFLRYVYFYMEQNCGVYLVCIIEQMSDLYFIEKNILEKELRVPLSKDRIPYLIFLDKTSLQADPYFFTMDPEHKVKVL